MCMTNAIAYRFLSLSELALLYGITPNQPFPYIKL